MEERGQRHRGEHRDGVPGVNALLLILMLTAGQTPCASPNPLPIPKRIWAIGNSIMAGSCSTTTPPAKLDAMLPGGLKEGWLVIPGGIPGENTTQIKARWDAGKLTACNGEPCKVLWLEGGINDERTLGGTADAAAQAAIDNNVAIITNARSLGYLVIWQSIHPFGAFGNAGPDPINRAAAYQTKYKARCALYVPDPFVQCLDVYDEFDGAVKDGLLDPALTCDGVHLYQPSTDRLAQLAYEALLRMVVRP